MAELGKTKRRSWVGALFGLVFFVAGVTAFSTTAIPTIIGYVKSSDWIEVPVKIDSVELVSHRGSDSTTYTVESDYSFNLNGQSYQSDQVSLNAGKDSVGSYWQDLHAELNSAKRQNEATAFVNPDNPFESVLDRTFRWELILFGSMFLLIFGGAGGFVAWFCLQTPKPASDRVKHNAQAGIASNQKSLHLAFGVFGGIFLLVGLSFGALALPDAIGKEQYAALFVLIFPVVGIGILAFAWKEWRAYKRFGPSPLFLNPLQPCIGGQLGGTFSFDLPSSLGSAKLIDATLICTKKTKSGKSTIRTVLWEEASYVYTTRTANGIKGEVLFDIPDSCSPTKQRQMGSSIGWAVCIEANFEEHGFGKFVRRWDVEVSDSNHIEHKISTITIPEAFVEKSENRLHQRAVESANEQIQLSQSANSVTIISSAGRHKVNNFVGIAIGAIFSAIGFFTLGEWFGAYFFIILGLFLAGLSLFALGSGVQVNINKFTRAMRTKKYWMGIPYGKRETKLINPTQFKLAKTSAATSGGKHTEFYKLLFDSDGKKIVLAKAIKGKAEAEVLKNSIIDMCF